MTNEEFNQKEEEMKKSILQQLSKIAEESKRIDEITKLNQQLSQLDKKIKSVSSSLYSRIDTENPPKSDEWLEVNKLIHLWNNLQSELLRLIQG